MRRLLSLLLCLTIPAQVFSAAPTLVAYQETSYSTTVNSKSTPSFTWQTGDIFVAIAGTEGSGASDYPTVPTATGLTFASIQVNTAASTSCGSRLSTSTASGSGSGAVTATDNGTGGRWGMSVWQFRDSDGFGNSTEQHTATRTKSLTSAQADSAIMWGIFDWGAGAVGTLTPTPTTTRQRTQVAGVWTYYVADLLDQPSTSPVSYGLTGSGGGPYSIVVGEVKNIASAPGIIFVPRRIIITE